MAEKGERERERERERELTRRIERVFKPPCAVRARGGTRRLARLGGGKSKSGSERWVDFRSADVVDSLSPLCGRNVRMRGSVSLEDIKYIGINVLPAEYGSRLFGDD